jgi:hypothetical protein
MKEILIACGDVDLLRQLVADLPPDTYKPIATRRGAGIVDKLGERPIVMAIVHISLEDNGAGELLKGLRARAQATPTLLLTPDTPPAQGPFDVAIRYPVPGPVYRNAINRLIADRPVEHDLEKWKAFYQEVKERLANAPQQNYFNILSVPNGAPHHAIVKAFDSLSLRYHPDRYNQFRSERWGAALHDKVNVLYKLMTEAYSVLSDRRLRSRYEAALAEGQLRLAKDETSAVDKGPRSIEDLGTSPASKKFLRLAQTDLAKGNIASALQNLSFALSMEPGNTAIAQKIEELKAT